VLARRLVVLLACLPLAACVDSITEPVSSGSDATSDDDPMFDATTLASMNGYHAFAKVNTRAYTSSIGAFAINVYAHGSTSAYETIHPDALTTAQIAVGTAIVREVLDANGTVGKLTMMVKGPAGYDPTLGDWWFAVTDPEGNVIPDDAGDPQVGRVDACHSCHIPRASDDYLFGVPKTDE
jgi:hypothetical protein